MGFPFAKKKKKSSGGAARESSDSTEERLIALTPSTITSGGGAAAADDRPESQPEIPRKRGFFQGRRKRSEAHSSDTISKPNSSADETTTITTAGTPATHSTITPCSDQIPVIERLSISTEGENGRIEVFTPESRHLVKSLFPPQQAQHIEAQENEDISTTRTSDSALDERNSRADDRTAPINNRQKSQLIDVCLPDYGVRILAMGRSASPRSENTRDTETVFSEENTINKYSPQRHNAGDSLTLSSSPPSAKIRSNHPTQNELFADCVPREDDSYSKGSSLDFHSRDFTLDELTAESAGMSSKAASLETKGKNGPISTLMRCNDAIASLNCTDENDVDPVTKQPFNIMQFFYDPFCNPNDLEDAPRRPYFDEHFTLRFLREMLSKGVSLLYLHPPGTPGNSSIDDWKGRSVIMKLVPGTAMGDSQSIQPKLTWSNMPGGKVSRRIITSICLLKILSISTHVEEMRGDSDDESDDLCFFTLTTTAGEVHMFEAASATQKDKIATGLRNLIARLAFHLVAGDATASNELYSSDIQGTSGELPSLPSPRQNMNRIAHAMLDG
jgi:hypothetical protein